MEDKWKLGRYFNFFIFLFFLTGIIAAKFISSYLFFASVFVLAVFLVYFFSQKKKELLSDLAVFISLFSLGALLFLSSGTVAKEIFLEGRPEVKLRVTSLPSRSDNRNVFSATVLNIEGHRQNFKVRVFDYSQKMEYLNKYQLKANLSKRVYRGSDFYNLWVRKDTRLKRLSLSFWEKLVKKANRYCLKVFRQNCSPAAKNFLAAIFLGRRELLAGEQVFMRKAGLAHLLAVSGLHIGLISLILFYFLRFFNLNFRSSLLISSVFLVFYAALTGMRVSVQRSILMYLVFAFGFVVNRKQDLLNSLGFAGAALLLFSPSLIYDLGFQLSFLAVFGIIAGFKIFPYKSHDNFFVNNIKQLFLSSLFVFLFLFPLTSYYFGRIHFFSIFYNIILIPFFALILFLNFFLIVLSPFVFLARNLGAVLSWLIYFFQSLTRFLGSLPIAYFTYSFSFQKVIIYYFFLFLLIFAFFLKKNKNRFGNSTLADWVE